jgi:glutaredoxin
MYIINRLFCEITLKEPIKKKDYNIHTESIVILTQTNCPYCIKLEEMIEKSTKKITRITLKSDGTFSFDSVFLDLPLEERDSIIKGVHEMLTDGAVLFPTIIHNNKINVGLPDKTVMSSIFN